MLEIESIPSFVIDEKSKHIHPQSSNEVETWPPYLQAIWSREKPQCSEWLPWKDAKYITHVLVQIWLGVLTNLLTVSCYCYRMHTHTWFWSSYGDYCHVHALIRRIWIKVKVLLSPSSFYTIVLRSLNISCCYYWVLASFLNGLPLWNTACIHLETIVSLPPLDPRH